MSKELFDFVQAEIEQEVKQEEGYAVFSRVTTIINHIGKNFSSMLGGEMAELQYKLSGYKYYLSSFVAELQRLSEFYHLEIKNYKAKEWSVVSDKIKAEKGKVSNKEEIENEIIKQTYEMASKQIVYETLYYQYRVKLSAIDNIITALVQRLSVIKREIEAGLSI